MDMEVWCATVHGVAKSWTWLSDWTTATVCEYSTQLNLFLGSQVLSWMMAIGLWYSDCPQPTPSFEGLFTDRGAMLSWCHMTSSPAFHNLSNFFFLFSSVAQLCLTLCNPMDCTTPAFLVHHQLLELAQTHVHRVSDDIQPFHPVSSPSPPAFNLPQHQSLFKWVSSLHQVAKVLELQLQHQSLQWMFRTDFL